MTFHIWSWRTSNVTVWAAFCFFQLSGVYRRNTRWKWQWEPDEKTDWPREEHRKASLWGTNRLDEVVFEILTQNKADEETRRWNVDLTKHIANNTKSQKRPHIKDTAIFRSVSTYNANHHDDRIKALFGNIDKSADPLDGIEHTKEHNDIRKKHPNKNAVPGIWVLGNKERTYLNTLEHEGRNKDSRTSSHQEYPSSEVEWERRP